MKMLGLIWKGDSGSSDASKGGDTGRADKSGNRFTISRQGGWKNMVSADESQEAVDNAKYEAKVLGSSQGMSRGDYQLQDVRQLTPEGHIYKKTEVSVTAV